MSTARALLSTALDGGGWICIFVQKDDRQWNKFFKPGDYDAAIRYAEAQDKGGNNVYFCTATLKESGNRKAINAHAIKAIKLDLDVSSDPRDFQTREQAIAELKSFCKSVGLPKPTIVSSGGGFHVYWFLSYGIDTEYGKFILDRFKALTIHFGLKADPTTTADIVRVLRLPGTHNHKDPANPRAVEVLTPITAHDTDTLCDLIEHTSLPAGTGPVVMPLFAGADIAHLQGEDKATKALAGEDKQMHTRFSKLLRLSLEGKGCAQVHRLWDARASAGEEDWRDLIGLAKFNDDGEQAIQIVSQDHPDYGETDTINKAAKIPKPFLCTHFQEGLHKRLCGDCKHKAKIRTPLVLGQYTPRATAEDNVVLGQNVAVDSQPRKYVIPQYPPKYFRGKHGGVFRESDEEDKPDTLICRKDFYALTNLKEQNSDLLVELCVNNGLDGVNQFVLPMSDLNGEAFRKLLPAKGVKPPLVKVGFNPLQQYVQDFHDFIQLTKAAVPVKHQFGWTKEFKSFVIGEREIVKHGDGSISVEYSQPSPSLNNMAQKFGWSGELSEWKKTVAAYATDPRMFQHRFGVLLGLAAPLMPLLNQKGVVVNLFGEKSGHGKSTLLKVQATMWGSPTCMMTYGDTENSRYQTMGMYKNIPATVDEMTNVPPDKFKNFLFNTSQGKGKDRMEGHSNTLRVNNTSWETLVSVSSNTCYAELMRVDKSGNEGEYMRLMEVEFGEEQRNCIPKAEADVLFGALENNYGHAGEVYIKHVLNLGVDVVRNRLINAQREFDAALAFESKERFWSAVVTTAYVAGVMAQECKLLDFDMVAMAEWMKQFVGGLKVTQSAGTTDEAKDDILAEYMAEFNGGFVYVNVDADGKQFLTALPAREILGRVNRYLNSGRTEVYVLRKPFCDYLSGRNVHVKGYFKQMAASGRPLLDCRTRLLLVGLLKDVKADTESAKKASMALRCYKVITDFGTDEEKSDDEPEQT